MLTAPNSATIEVREQTTMAVAGGGMLIWPGALRDLDRRSPGYDV